MLLPHQMAVAGLPPNSLARPLARSLNTMQQTVERTVGESAQSAPLQQLLHTSPPSTPSLVKHPPPNPLPLAVRQSNAWIAHKTKSRTAKQSKCQLKYAQQRQQQQQEKQQQQQEKQKRKWCPLYGRTLWSIKQTTVGHQEMELPIRSAPTAPLSHSFLSWQVPSFVLSLLFLCCLSSCGHCSDIYSTHECLYFRMNHLLLLRINSMLSFPFFGSLSFLLSFAP